MQSMNIGEAAAAAGVTPKMIRHYETLGLVPEPDRTEAGYRLYGEREVAMLRFIRQSRGLGFSTKQIESLLALWRDDGRESREVKQVAAQQLAELEERQREIDQMRSTLQQLVARPRPSRGTCHDGRNRCEARTEGGQGGNPPAHCTAQARYSRAPGDDRPRGPRCLDALHCAGLRAGPRHAGAWAGYGKIPAGRRIQ